LKKYVICVELNCLSKEEILFKTLDTEEVLGQNSLFTLQIPYFALSCFPFFAKDIGENCNITSMTCFACVFVLLSVHIK